MIDKDQLVLRLKKIKLVALDVDGVLTDGRVYLDADGRETRAFNFKDIMGISRLKKRGVKVALISGEKNAVIDRFCRKLGIEKNYQNCREKDKAIDELTDYYKLKPEDICFIGDDINDIPVFKKVGLAVGVSNGWEGIMGSAHIVTKNKGGNGAVREICELIIANI
ncbi:MAG: HAD-IIIA family hydrolase [Candidatus Omnitrophica bacterium]|nr:HAD-IIIA family hydrolase [Candidatus Omnitrophota bacterium]